MDEDLIQIVEQAEEVESSDVEEVISLATIASVESDGIKITLDGADSASDKHYKCNTGVRFQNGDRVMVSKESGSYIIEFPIGAPNSNLPVPAGGTADYVLTKNTNDDFDYSWKEVPNPIPTGGAIKQVLMKRTASDRDIKWGSIDINDLLPSGGSAGQYLQKTSTSTGVTWATPVISQLKSGSYTITLNNLNLTPSNASYINIGTQLYPFNNLYVNGSIALGTNTNAKLGFFGTTPILKQSLLNTATVSQVITALKNYGLFT